MPSVNSGSVEESVCVCARAPVHTQQNISCFLINLEKNLCDKSVSSFYISKSYFTHQS